MSSESTDNMPKKRKIQQKEPIKLTREEEALVARFMKESNILYSDKTKAVKKEAEEYREHIERFLREYLKTYIILGYDTHGERVLYTHASTSEEKDALLTYITKYFIILNKPQD